MLNANRLIDDRSRTIENEITRIFQECAQFDCRLQLGREFSYTGRVVKLRFFELAGDGRIGEQGPAFVLQG